jgi:hypothetical protein
LRAARTLSVLIATGLQFIFDAFFYANRNP